MRWQYTPYALPLLIAAAISAALAFIAWRRRAVSGATSFVLLMLAVFDWTLGYALEMAAVDLSSKLFWAKAQYLGIGGVPMMLLIFAVQYTGRKRWLTHRNLMLLAIFPFRGVEIIKRPT